MSLVKKRNKNKSSVLEFGQLYGLDNFINDFNLTVLPSLHVVDHGYAGYEDTEVTQLRL
jgi:hypothetical protein